MALQLPTSGNLSEPQQQAILAKFKRIPFFNGLSDDELLGISSYFAESHASKDTIIFYELDEPQKSGSKIYFVESGSIKLVKYSNEGESTIVRLATAGEFFGVTGALTGQTYPFSAEALVDSTLLSIGAEQFQKLIGLYPKLAINMIVAMGEVLWFNYATHNQVVKKSEARVAKILLHHMKRDGFEETAEGYQLKIQLPHDYIASMTGIAYEESVRIISRLKKQFDCIQYLRGGKILVTNLAALKTVAQDEP